MKALFQLTNVSSFIRAIFPMIKLAWHAHPVCFAALLILEIMQGILPLLGAWVTKALFDLLAYAMQGQVLTDLPQNLLLLLSAQATLIVLNQISGPVNGYLNAELSQRLTLNVQSIVYTKINNLMGLAYFENPHFHDTLQLGSQGAQQGPRQAFSIFTTLVRNTLTLGAFLGVLITFSPLLTLTVILAVLPQLFAQLKLSHHRVDLAYENNSKARLAGYYGYILSGLPFAKELRLFNLGDHFLRGFVHTSQKIQRTEQRQRIRELRWQMPLTILTSLVASGAFVIVIYQAFSGRLTLGDVVLYTSVVSSVQNALFGIIFAFTGLNESVLFYKHFTELMSLPQPIFVTNSAQKVPPLTLSIELRNVSFRYSDQHPWILHKVNLVMPAGQCVALVGLNGAGKSTIVKLLTRLYDPTEGQILWNGYDIRMFDPQELRHRIGAIFQDFIRYDLTAQENIGIGDVTYIENMDRVRQAAVQAGVHNTIDKLPQQYQTILSRLLAGNNYGFDLSGGEWQKIALARMFMRKADLLILDEPTAALDAQAEYELYHRFVQLMQGRTSLLISHRFSTVRMADIIAVLEDGKIVECGSHESLIRQGERYAQLYRMQVEQYQESGRGQKVVAP